MISKAPAKYDSWLQNWIMKPKLHLNVCFLLQGNKSKQHSLRYRSYLCHVHHLNALTHFPSWLSKQTLCNWLGLFGTDMKCIVFHRNWWKPEDQFCSLTLLSPALSQTSWKHASISQACWRGQNKNPTWGRNPSYNFLYAFI